MLISIDHNDPRPVYQQIAAAVKQQLRTGLLAPGDELPSVRELADALNINLHTVRHAYQLLSEQSVVRLRLGRRTRILEPSGPPANLRQVNQSLRPRVEELVADAMQSGLTADDVRRLMDQVLGAPKKRGHKP